MTKNAALENFMTRRSIRAFKSDPVDHDTLQEIIEAGLYAPSGMGKQAPIIVAITNPDIIKRLAEANRAVGNFPEGMNPFYGAPAVLVVLANRDVATYVYDGACAMENLQLAANALGLGSIWIHRAREVFDMPEWKQWLADLGVEGNYEGIGNCCVGYTDAEPKAADRKDGRVFWAE